MRPSRVGGVLRGTLLSLVVAVMLLPVYAMVAVASASDATDLGGLGFDAARFGEHLTRLFGQGDFPLYLRNSVILSLGVAVLEVVLSGAAGYALAQLAFPGRRVLFAVVVGTLSLSPIVVLVPMYLVVRQLGWIDTFQGMIVPFAVSAFGVFLVRQFALSLPRELLLSARVDGAGELRIFLRVAVPLLRPALLTLFLLQFLAQWDNLLWPLVVANKPGLWPLPVGLSQLQTEYDFSAGLVGTAALVTAVPPLALMFVLQRYYVAGLTLGGVKK
ncbi:carbohydrate ABC transporter permease [Nonomuraea rhodomycinica]|uniref:Carbohydrate ABC transporter permease n=1 Tax=Nonomuraea rhodomycinica TaxID=1712872 RepID=A0A7Y6IPW5_9ACTN|nr:carbohydrate ABC transporter permease [Nonomuraea rhodomycinica]NUW42162.1 carbohydrate ABC transporter permease [Nonomuraea rhodomycinica]